MRKTNRFTEIPSADRARTRTLECLGCVASEQEIAFGDGFMAGETRRQRRCRSRVSVLIELRETPASRGRVLLCVFHHELEICRHGRSCYKGLRLPKHAIVFLRGRISPRDPCNRGTVRERQCAVTICLHRDVVSQDRANVVELPCLVSRYPGWILTSKIGAVVGLPAAATACACAGEPIGWNVVSARQVMIGAPKAVIRRTLHI
jgi:hypothetical protein